VISEGPDQLEILLERALTTNIRGGKALGGEFSGKNHSSKSFLKTITWLSTFGGVLFGYDTGVINGALPYMSRPDQLNLSSFMEGLVSSSLLFGAAIGSLVAGRLSDHVGRRKVLLYLAILFLFSTLGCTLSPTAEVMIGFRFLLGLAVGAASAIVPMLLAEMATPELRGRMVNNNDLMVVSGQLAAFVFNAIIANTLGDHSNTWRYMMVLATIPAVGLWFGMLIVPESPRWLASNGKIGAALDVLRRIREESLAQSELQEIQQNITEENKLSKATFKDLGVPWIRRIVFIGIGIGIVQQVTGVNSIMYYGTEILQSAGFGIKAAIIGNMANGVISVIGFLVGFYNLRKFSRRKLLMGGQIGIITTLCLIAIVPSVLKGTAVMPYVVLLLTVSFLFFQQSAVSVVTWVLLAEIFPLRLRGLGMGIAVFFLWIADFFVGLLFPPMLSHLGLTYTYLVFVAVNLLAVAFTKFCVPETKGFTLEELEQRFRTHGRGSMHSIEKTEHVSVK
jgi:major inositol transporter-like SP family MFS transporter